MRIVPSLLCVAALGCTSSSDPARLKPSPLSRLKPEGGAGGLPSPRRPLIRSLKRAPKGEPGVRLVGVKDGDTIPNGFRL